MLKTVGGVFWVAQTGEPRDNHMREISVESSKKERERENRALGQIQLNCAETKFRTSTLFVWERYAKYSRNLEILGIFY